MLTINDIMKPQLIMQKFYFTDNLGEVKYDSSTDSREEKKEFLRNYGKCRVIGMNVTHSGYISINFNLPHCPIGDIDCPYYWSEGCSQYCLCDNPMDECDDFYAMNGE